MTTCKPGDRVIVESPPVYRLTDRTSGVGGILDVDTGGDGPTFDDVVAAFDLEDERGLSWLRRARLAARLALLDPEVAAEVAAEAGLDFEEFEEAEDEARTLDA